MSAAYCIRGQEKDDPVVGPFRSLPMAEKALGEIVRFDVREGYWVIEPMRSHNRVIPMLRARFKV